jgi:hypothetical protein
LRFLGAPPGGVFARHQASSLSLSNGIQEHVRFLSVVDAKTGQKVRNSMEASARLNESQQEVPIHGELK